MCLQFGFVIFWPKDFGAKAAHKMFVKLTPGLLHQSPLPDLLLNLPELAVGPHLLVGLPGEYFGRKRFGGKVSGQW